MESMDSQREMVSSMVVSIHVLLSCLRALSVLEDEYCNRRVQIRKMIRMYRKRRMPFLHQLQEERRCLVSGAEFIRLPAVFRRYWVRPSSKDWWENFVLQVWNDERWIETFRMTRATLFEIVAELTPLLQRKQTAMRDPISVAKRVAICIWKLANPGFYKNAAEQFGVGRSTVGQVFVEVCLAMELVLLRRTVYLGDYRKEDADKLHSISHILEGIVDNIPDANSMLRERNIQ